MTDFIAHSHYTSITGQPGSAPPRQAGSQADAHSATSRWAFRAFLGRERDAREACFSPEFVQVTSAHGS